MRLLSYFLSITFLIFITQRSYAQMEAGSYDFTATTASYAPLVGGTVLSSLEADTKIESPVPLGFTFYFEGLAYDSVRASSNGILSFNNTSGTTNSGTSNDLDYSISGLRPLVAPLWDDLDGRASGGSTASYMTTGSAPNRVFTFEWSAWEWDYGAGDSVLSFQVKLYETTNIVEFIYEQGPAAVTSADASIGIAGVMTGPGHFLSLNNTSAAPQVSNITETNTISVKPATGQVYRFQPPVVFPLDMRATGVIAPVFDGCYTNSETVDVIIKNNGSATIDFSVNNTTVGAIVTGPNATTLTTTINSGTLAPSETDTISVSVAYDMTAAGSYVFQGYTQVTGDAKTSNDTALLTSSAVNMPVDETPQNVTFTGFTGADLSTVFPDWHEGDGEIRPTGTSSDWRDISDLGGTGNITAAINLYSDDDREWIVGPKVMVYENTELAYKVAVTDWDDITLPDAMGSDDKLYVMVSTDCGFTWIKEDSVTAADNLTQTLTKRTVDLTPYAGQVVMVGFMATDGTVDDSEDYDLHLDDITIRQIDLLTPPSGTRYVNEGIGADTIDAVWTEIDILTGPVTYHWLLDTVGGDFSSPYLSYPSNNGGNDTMLTIDAYAIDAVLTGLGVNVGDSIDLIWTVRAFNGTDSSQAKEAFALRIVRGQLLDDFDLLTPSDGFLLSLEGNENNVLRATWESSADSAEYIWILESALGNPVTIENTGKDTLIDLTYGQIDSYLSGVAMGTTINLQWTVGAIIGEDTMYADNGYFMFDVTRGPVTGEFALLMPSDNTAITIEGDQTETLVFNWEDAQVNGDGDVTYTWYLDVQGSDFTSPLMTSLSDNGGTDETATITYDDIAVMLRDNGIAIGEVFNAQWTVITGAGDTAMAPFFIDLTRGIMTGIEDHSADNGFEIYPNPSDGRVRINASGLSGATVQLQITGLEGKVVFDERVTTTQGQISRSFDLTDLENGVYFITLYQENAVKTMRLIIQH